MKTLSSIEAKTRFGEIAEIVAREPLEVRNQNRVAFFAVSSNDYRRLADMEKRVRRDALDALHAVQDEIESRNLSDADKADLLSDFNLAEDD